MSCLVSPVTEPHNGPTPHFAYICLSAIPFSINFAYDSEKTFQLYLIAVHYLIVSICTMSSRKQVLGNIMKRFHNWTQ